MRKRRVGIVVFGLLVAWSRAAGADEPGPCRCGATTGPAAPGDRGAAALAAPIAELEPIPTARPGPPPDRSWLPTLGPGEWLVPGSVRDIPVRTVAAQGGIAPVVAPPPVVSAPAAPSVGAPYAQAPYAASCYTSSYGAYAGSASYYAAQGGLIAAPAPAPVIAQPAPVYARPAPVYVEPAPVAPPVRERPRRGMRFALRQHVRLRVGAEAELGNRLEFGTGSGACPGGYCPAPGYRLR